MLSGTELFNKITGLDLEDGSESQLLSQINAYQKDQGLKSGVYEDEVIVIYRIVFLISADIEEIIRLKPDLLVPKSCANKTCIIFFILICVDNFL